MFNVLSTNTKMLIRGSEGHLPMTNYRYGGWLFAFFSQKGSEME